MKLIDLYQDERTRRNGTALAYQLLAERPAYANISHTSMPTLQQHEQYVASRPYRHWMVISVEQLWVGAMYATRQNEIGVAILEQSRGHGYAGEALRLYMNEHQPFVAIHGCRLGSWIARVAPYNKASHRLFEKLGAAPIEITYRLPG